RYLSTNAAIPREFSHSATCLPSWSDARIWYPPPGQTTTEAPLAVSGGASQTVMVGRSRSGSLPTAPGAPAGQSGSAGRWPGPCTELDEPVDAQRSPTVPHATSRGSTPRTRLVGFDLLIFDPSPCGRTALVLLDTSITVITGLPERHRLQ